MQGFRFPADRICVSVLAVTFASSLNAQDVDGAKVLDGLGATEDDIATLESGEIIAYSDEAYENSPRELSADAVMLIDTDLDAIVAALVDAVTVIPTKLMIAHSEISSEADFANVAYTEEDIDEVEELFKLRPGKDFNLSTTEFEFLNKRLGPHRKGSTADKIAAASDAMREILIARYNRYQADGLRGIESYWRSKRKQVDVGEELFLTTDTFRPFEPDFPEYFHVIENYPSGATRHRISSQVS